MKKLLLLFLLFNLNTKAQEKWRALTLTQTSGVSAKGDKFAYFSSSFHYDLNNKFFLSNWTGIQLQNYQSYKSSWFSTQSTINRYVGKWMIGVGAQYGMASIPEARYFTNNSTYFITNVSYRFKLK